MSVIQRGLNGTVQYLKRVKYLCDYGTDNCPICPGIKAVTSDVQTRAFLLLQQAEYFIKALISTSPLFEYLCRESNPFILPTGPPAWQPRLLPHMSVSQTVPWPLVLRLMASTKLLLYRTSLPHLIISRTRTIWSEWIWSRWSPWPAAGCPLSA
jgi:hypothetical protein